MRGKKALKSIIATFIQKAAAILCGFIIPKLIISNFGSNVNGLITSITQFLGYITLLESGVGPVIKSQLYKPIANKDNREIENILAASERFFKKIAKIFIIYIIVLLIIYPIIVSNQFDAIFTISLIIIISISIFAEYYFGMTYKLYIQAEQQSYVISIFQMITTILNTIIILILIKFGFGILLIKLLSSILFIFRPILQNIYVKKKFNINLKNSNKNYKLKQKWDGLIQHIAAVIHTNTDVIILTIFENVLEVSVYSVYNLITNGIKNLIQSVVEATDSAFGDMIAKGEEKQLDINFTVYELLYYYLISIIYSSLFVLTIPFIKIYTKGVSDVNYIRPLFAILMIGSEYANAIRFPYNALVKSAGRFRETKKGAIIEAIINLTISIILVFKFGIIGVAIGTTVAMIIRSAELIYYSSRNILNRKKNTSIKKIIVCTIEVICIYIIFEYIKIPIEIDSYIRLIIYSIIVLLIATFLIFVVNLFMFYDEWKLTYKKILKIVRKEGKNEGKKNKKINTKNNK